LSGIDDAEYQRLAEAVRATERLAVENPNIRNDAGAAFLMSTKARIEVLDREFIGSESTEKKDKRSAASAAIAMMVDRETRLNEQEKEAYAEFLEKDYFTKKDFKNLDAFYAVSFDKLTEAGKAEMSERVLGGIRRGEYEMNDLPESVQEPTREYSKAKAGKQQGASSEKLPEYLDTQREEELSSSSSNKKETAKQNVTDERAIEQVKHEVSDDFALGNLEDAFDVKMPDVPHADSTPPTKGI